MKDYLIWAGEEMEKQYGMNAEFWMDYIMSGHHVPQWLSFETYINKFFGGKKNAKGQNCV